MEVEEVHDVDRFLQACVNDGYVLHGSSVLCDVLEPHKASCTTGLEENLQKAVYATTEAAVAIFHAISPPKPRYMSWEFRNGRFHFEADEQTINRLGEGYVYVLDGRNFKKCQYEEGQYICLNEVRPVRIIKVSASDFKSPISAISAKI